jgi:hypothetical protein
VCTKPCGFCSLAIEHFRGFDESLGSVLYTVILCTDLFAYLNALSEMCAKKHESLPSSLSAIADGTGGDVVLGRLFDLLAKRAVRSGVRVRVIIEADPMDR